MLDKLLITFLFGASLGVPAAYPGQEDPSSRTLSKRGLFDFELDDPALADPQPKASIDEEIKDHGYYSELDPEHPIEGPILGASRLQERIKKKWQRKY
ncbi:hypothetical protein DSO57_1010691 [Entomophthora muscae]|uniref:Uncharacterized protein n=1 Tax=Entomophthora muscae TaxID=34485 RepID=A0ACC2SJG9_9FUNG|nr:hypothetical protein DSO57_1010691 [Entomophthora muscae]